MNIPGSPLIVLFSLLAPPRCEIVRFYGLGVSSQTDDNWNLSYNGRGIPNLGMFRLRVLTFGKASYGHASTASFWFDNWLELNGFVEEQS
ncbi:unnamed protein product, partial [Thlaspi arvense]